MAEQSKCPSLFSSLNFLNLEKQLKTSSIPNEEVARMIATKKTRYDEHISKVKIKLVENNPTFEDAEEVIKARILMTDDSVPDDDWRLSKPPVGYEGKITPQIGGNRNRITINSNDIEERSFVVAKSQTPTVGGVAIIYKLNSDKINIDSISNENIKTLVKTLDKTLKNKSDKTKDSQECYFNNYIVKFLSNDVTFIVVDNHLHFK